MTELVNKVWKLVKRPVGDLDDESLKLFEEKINFSPESGQVLFRTIYLSLDPTNRIWMSDMDQYMEPVHLGEVMRGLGVLTVQSSTNEKFPVGSLWTGLCGWQLYTVSNGDGLSPLQKHPDLPLDAYLSAISVVIGCTAYVGLLDVGTPKEGETLVVSAAAGAVGSIVGQIGKIKGMRVVGIAGSDDKCSWIKNELGFDEAINYKTTPDLEKALREACPKGIDVYFENVGGKVLDTVLKLLNNNARVPLCGLISGYNASSPVPGPYNFHMILMRRVKVQGFIVLDHANRFGDAFSDLTKWILEGKLKYRSDIVKGLENAPSALKKLFDGSNTGKLIVQVSDTTA